MTEFVIKRGPDDTKPMSMMEPLEVGVIVDDSSSSNGHIVMRTASLRYFEVMDLSDPRIGGCWTVGCDIPVRIVKARITVEVEE